MRLLTTSALVLLLATPALAANGLNARQGRLLADSGAPLVLPTRLPPGFRVDRVVVSAEQEGGPGGGAHHVVLYAGPDDKGFGIENVTGGIGGLPYTPAMTMHNRALSKSPIALYSVPPGRNSRANSWLSDWIEVKGHYCRLVGSGYVRDLVAPDFMWQGELSKAQAQLIVESLRVVSP